MDLGWVCFGPRYECGHVCPCPRVLILYRHLMGQLDRSVLKELVGSCGPPVQAILGWFKWYSCPKDKSDQKTLRSTVQPTDPFFKTLLSTLSRKDNSMPHFLPVNMVVVSGGVRIKS